MPFCSRTGLWPALLIAQATLTFHCASPPGAVGPHEASVMESAVPPSDADLPEDSAPLPAIVGPAEAPRAWFSSEAVAVSGGSSPDAAPMPSEIPLEFTLTAIRDRSVTGWLELSAPVGQTPSVWKVAPNGETTALPVVPAPRPGGRGLGTWSVGPLEVSGEVQVRARWSSPPPEVEASGQPDFGAPRSIGIVLDSSFARLYDVESQRDLVLDLARRFPAATFEVWESDVACRSVEAPVTGRELSSSRRAQSFGQALANRAKLGASSIQVALGCVTQPKDLLVIVSDGIDEELPHITRSVPASAVHWVLPESGARDVVSLFHVARAVAELANGPVSVDTWQSPSRWAMARDPKQPVRASQSDRDRLTDIVRRGRPLGDPARSAAALDPLEGLDERGPLGGASEPSLQGAPQASEGPAEGASYHDEPEIPSSPDASAGPPQIPAETIQRIVRLNRGRFRRCLLEARARQSHAPVGRALFEMEIDSEGTVPHAETVTSDLDDPVLTLCLIETFESLTFPKPPSGRIFVRYPFRLDWAGSATDPPMPLPKAAATAPKPGPTRAPRAPGLSDDLVRTLEIGDDPTRRLPTHDFETMALRATLLGDFELRRGRGDEATRWYDTAGVHDDSTGRFHQLAGERLLGIGTREADALAVHHLLLAQERLPSGKDRWLAEHALAWALVRTGEPAVALALIGETLSRDRVLLTQGTRTWLQADLGYLGKAMVARDPSKRFQVELWLANLGVALPVRGGLLATVSSTDGWALEVHDPSGATADAEAPHLPGGGQLIKVDEARVFHLPASPSNADYGFSAELRGAPSAHVPWGDSAEPLSLGFFLRVAVDEEGRTRMAIQTAVQNIKGGAVPLHARAR